MILTRLCKENVAEIFRLLRQYKTQHPSVNRIFEQQAPTACAALGNAHHDDLQMEIPERLLRLKLT